MVGVGSGKPVRKQGARVEPPVSKARPRSGGTASFPITSKTQPLLHTIIVWFSILLFSIIFAVILFPRTETKATTIIPALQAYEMHFPDATWCATTSINGQCPVPSQDCKWKLDNNSANSSCRYLNTIQKSGYGGTKNG